MQPLNNDTVIKFEPTKLQKALGKLDGKIEEAEQEIKDSTLIGPIGKFWGADEEEDEEEGNKKKERMPLGTREHAIFVSALVTSFALSGYLGSKSGESTFAASLAAPSLEIVKKYFLNTDKTPLLRKSMVGLSTVAIAGSFYLSYQQNEQLPMRVLRAMPWAYPMFGILKATASPTISEMLKCKNITPMQKKISVALFQIILVVGLQIALIKANIHDPTLAAACGIFYKTNARALTNIGGDEASKIESRSVRILTGGTMALFAIAATAIGYAGNSLAWFDNFQGFMIGYLLITMTDIFVRTLKQSIRLKIIESKVHDLKKQKVNLINDVHDSKEPSWQHKTVEGVKKVGYGLINCVVPVSAAFVLGALNPDPNQAGNPGLIASLTQDATSLCKLPTKLIPIEAVFTAATSAVGLGVAGYTVKELPNITGINNGTALASIPDQVYSTMIALACIAASLGAYHIRREIRPPRVHEVVYNAELEQLTKEAKAEVSETTPLLT